MPGDSKTRPGGNRTGREVAWAATAILPDAAADGTDPRPRCVLCGLPLTAPRSLARGFGPVCWTRTALVQLDARRDAVGRRLRVVAGLVARLDANGLAIVSAALEDALSALDAEGVDR